jgi:hypothetical protein
LLPPKIVDQWFEVQSAVLYEVLESGADAWFGLEAPIFSALPAQQNVCIRSNVGLSFNRIIDCTLLNHVPIVLKVLGSITERNSTGSTTFA